MDVDCSWPVSDDVDGLIAAIDGCRRSLRALMLDKLGRTQVESCDVYSGSRPIDLLRLSELWEACSDAADDRPDRSPRQVELVGATPLFRVHHAPAIGDEQVRVVVAAGGPDDAVPCWYGTVHLVLA